MVMDEEVVLGKIIKYTPRIRYYWNYKLLGQNRVRFEFAVDTAARMNPNYLIEQPIADLDSKIDELRYLSTESESILPKKLPVCRRNQRRQSKKFF